MIHFIDQHRKEVPILNPDSLSDIIQAAIENTRIWDHIVLEALRLITFGGIPDEQNEGRSGYRMYTYFTIPVCSFQTKLQEQRWCDNATISILQQVRGLFAGEAIAKQMNEFALQQDWTSNPRAPTNASNLPMFLANANIYSLRMSTLMNHLECDLCEEVMSHINSFDSDEEKYIDQVTTNTDDDHPLCLSRRSSNTTESNNEIN